MLLTVMMICTLVPVSAFAAPAEAEAETTDTELGVEEASGETEVSPAAEEPDAAEEAADSAALENASTQEEASAEKGAEEEASVEEGVEDGAEEGDAEEELSGEVSADMAEETAIEEPADPEETEEAAEEAASGKGRAASKEAKQLVWNLDDYDFEHAVEIPLGEAVTVDLTDTAPYQVFYFIPEETWVYHFYSESMSDSVPDPYGRMLFEDGDGIHPMGQQGDNGGDDDSGGSHGLGGHDFYFSEYLCAGQKYYLIADSYSSGSYPVILEAAGSASITLDANGGYFYNLDTEEAAGSEFRSTSPDGESVGYSSYAMNYEYDVAYEDHSLLGWTDEPDGGYTKDLHEWTAYDGMRLYAVWGDMITATFDANGGIFTSLMEGEEPCTSYEEKFAEGQTLKDWQWSYKPEKDGGYLMGWSTDPNADPFEVDDWMSLWVEDGQTYYAIWGDAITYTLYGNGGYLSVNDEPLEQLSRETANGMPLSSVLHWSVSREEDDGGSWAFAGWALSPDAGPSDVVDPEETAITDGYSEFYAVWARPYGVTVTFDANGGYFNDPADTEPRVYGFDAYNPLGIYINASRDDGYRFSGWELPDGTVLADEELYAYIPTEDVTFTAVWTKYITVTLDANGGYFDGYGGQTLECDLPEGGIFGAYISARPYYDYCTFECWEDADGNAIDPETYVPEDGEVFTARWLDDRITVTFKAGDHGYWDGGTDEYGEPIKLYSREEKIESGESLDLGYDVPISEDGFDITGWENEQTGEIYSVDDYIEIYEDVTLVARYSVAYTVRFVLGRGYSDNPEKHESVSVLHEGEEFRPHIPTVRIDDDHLAFSGWFTDEACTDPISEDEIREREYTSNVTYYAGYEEGYVLTIDANGGQISYWSNDRDTYIYLDELRLGFKKEEYVSLYSILDGFYFDPPESETGHYNWNSYIMEDGGTIDRESGFDISEDRTLRLNWEKEYAVTFHYRQDSEDTETYYFFENTTIYATSTPVSADPEVYGFAGWYTNGLYTGDPIDPANYTVTSDLELWAKFVPGIKVTFDAGEYGYYWGSDEEGEEIELRTIVRTVVPGYPIDLSDDAYRPEAYEDLDFDPAFDSWTYADGSEIPDEEYEAFAPTEPVTLKAKWILPYIITFDLGDAGVFTDLDEDAEDRSTYIRYYPRNPMFPLGGVPEYELTDESVEIAAWKDIDTGEEYSRTEIESLWPTQDMTFEPVFAEAVTITFDAGEFGYFYAGEDEETGEEIETKSTSELKLAKGAEIGWGYDMPSVKQAYKTSKLFDGFILADGTVLDEWDLRFYTPEEDETITVAYRDAAVITFYANGGYYWDGDDDEDSEYGAVSLTLPAGTTYDSESLEDLLSDNDYYLYTDEENQRSDGCYYYDSECTRSIDDEPLTLTKDTELYAGWIEQVIVTYDAGEGYFNGDPEDKEESVTVDKGSVYGRTVLNDEPSDPACENKVFAGWYLDAAFSNPVKNSMVISEDTVLHAKYSEEYYTVTFDAVDGVFSDGSHTKEVRVLKGSRGMAYLNEEPEIEDPEDIRCFAEWTYNGDRFYEDYFCPSGDMTVTASYKDGFSLTFSSGENGLLYDEDEEEYVKKTLLYGKYLFSAQKRVRFYAPSATDAAGRNLLGWSLTDGADTADYTDAFTADKPGAYVLYPVFGDEGTVTFYAGAHGEIDLYYPIWTDIYKNRSVTEKVTVGMPFSELNYDDWGDTGWSFDGWYTDAACTQQVDPDTAVFADGDTYYAGWSEDYRIRFETNGGNMKVYDNSEERYTNLLYVRKGDFLDKYYDINEPVREGYVFSGYYKDEALTDEIESIYNYIPTGDEVEQTIYVKWRSVSEVDSVCVRWHLVSSTGSGTFETGRFIGEREAAVYVEKGSVLDEAYAGYPLSDSKTAEFNGWFEDEACTRQITNFTRALEADLDIYAGYESLIKVTFDANGGYFDQSKFPSSIAKTARISEGIYVSDDYGIPSHDDGLKFVGWYEDPEGNTPIERTSNGYYTPGEDTTVYAKWAPSYDVYYHVGSFAGLDGSKGIVLRTYPEGEPAEEYIPTVYDPELTFEGWYLDENLTQKVTNFTFNKETDLFAKFKSSLYFVTVNANGGKLYVYGGFYGENVDGGVMYDDLQLGTDGTKTLEELFGSVLSNAEREGEYAYDLNLGWSTKQDGSDIVDPKTYKPAADVTLYAVWQPRVLLQFDAGAGTSHAYGDNSRFYVYAFKDKTLAEADAHYSVHDSRWPGLTEILTDVTPPEGLVFTGWYTAESGGMKIDANYTPTEPGILYARYEENACEHEWGDWVVTTPPTCTEEGVETRTCKKDPSHTETRPVAKIPHPLEKVPAKAATCEEAGNVEYYRCTACGALFADADGNTAITEASAVVVPAKGHDFGEWTQTTPATCTAAGEETRTCKNDPSHTETRPVEALGHTYKEQPVWTWTADAENGYSAVAAFACERGDDTQTVEAAVTKVSETPATEEADGEVVYKAAAQFMGKEYTDTRTDILPAAGHHYSETPEWAWSEDLQTAAATFKCTDPGCDKAIVKEVSVGDGIAVVAEAATCEKDGLETFTATVVVDGVTYTDVRTKVIPTSGHDWGEWTVTVKPTCEGAGEETRTCKNDPAHTETRPVEAAGHDWGEWTVTVKPTCGAAGEETRTCKTDPTHTETRAVEATGHDWGEWTVTKEATCTEGTEWTRTCKNDPKHAETRKGDTIPHSLEKVAAKAATCETAGNIEHYKCRMCGSLFADAAGTKALKAEDVTIAAKGHAWDGGTVTKAATTTAKGVKTYTCKNDPSHKKTEEIPMVKEAAPPAAGADGTSLGTGASAAAAAAAITSSTSEEGPAGSAYGVLQAKVKKAKKTSIAIKWTKVPGTTEYVIYGNKCGKGNKMVELFRTNKLTWTQTKLKKGTYYKYMVVAVKGTGSQATVLSSSKVIHITTTGGKGVNMKSLKINKTKVGLVKTVKKKKTFQIKVTPTPAGKKAAKHRPLTYESSDPAIATVSKKGKITAKAKGKCKIYIYAQDGTSKVIKVTVK